MPPQSSSQTQEELEKKLSEIRLQGSEDQYRALAQKLGLPFSDLSSAPIDVEALTLVPEPEARGALLAVLFKTGKNLTIATCDPELKEAKDVLASLSSQGYIPTLIITSPHSLERAWGRYALVKTQETFKVGSIDIEEEDLAKLEAEIKDVSDLQAQVQKVSTTKLLEIVIAGALRTSASDVHLEPQENKVRLRYRLDGLLQDIGFVDPETYVKLLNRIKVLSGLQLNIHKTPQDGRFTIHHKGSAIEVRVSVLPSEYGETLVMRLLDPRTIRTKLNDLGMRPELLALLKERLSKPTGAILTTGPTGSGKTTTLYACIEALNSPDSKIITIEDPIEYHIEGISQTQVDVKKKYTFADGLRAIVRQDPDIILVGEVRDGETAQIALQAALTGHLVLSTLHTNDAAGTVPRLVNFKIEPHIVASGIKLAMAQRLVRKLCPHCKKESKLSPEQLAKVQSSLSAIKKDVFESTLVYGPSSCDQCGQTGYSGRIGVFEGFAMTEAMEKLTLQNPAVSDIEKLAVQEGMITMLQDGYLKMIEGITSFDEIERVVG
ncbi:MAG TPA: GspE/PulE family protein [Candidatus Paceibacterota bacterium]